VFEGMLIRLTTGCAWVDVERLLDNRVSDTTLRLRRDEWIAAGVFDALVEEALEAYDRVVGLDFSECAVDGSQHKVPTGGEGTGPKPCDRVKRGWKWSLFAERNGIPIGWATAGTNRHDTIRSAATTAVLSIASSQASGSVRWSAPSVARPEPAPTRRPCPSGCAGPSNAPNSSLSNFSYDATPTGASPTGSHNSRSRSRCSQRSPEKASSGGFLRNRLQLPSRDFTHNLHLSST
jgi:hypothetical protein